VPDAPIENQNRRQLDLILHETNFLTMTKLEETQLVLKKCLQLKNVISQTKTYATETDFIKQTRPSEIKPKPETITLILET